MRLERVWRHKALGKCHVAALTVALDGMTLAFSIERSGLDHDANIQRKKADQ